MELKITEIAVCRVDLHKYSPAPSFQKLNTAPPGIRFTFSNMNLAVLIIVGAIGLGLIIFLVWSNIRDERAFKQQLNDDYHKTKDEEGDVDTEEQIQ
jgi:hypothetical protein